MNVLIIHNMRAYVRLHIHIDVSDLVLSDVIPGCFLVLTRVIDAEYSRPM